MPLPLGGLNILDASKSAAQRRKNVATAAGRGLWCCGGMSPFRGERVTSRDTFRRTPFRTSSTTRSTPPEMFSFDDVQGCSFKLAHNTTEISKHIVASLALQIGQSILCTEGDVCKQVGIGMPHGGLHWAKGGPIIRGRPGNLSPLKGAHLSPNR